jgi:alanine racemase
MSISDRPSRRTPTLNEVERAGTIVEIDLAAIVGNWRSLTARLAPETVCAAVVKADAYGLGVAQVAPALAAAGCRLFFVATLEEGLTLRRLLPQSAIAVLNGLVPAIPREFAQARLTPVLNDLGQVAAWRGNAAPAMLQLDTGMARLGLPPGELTLLEAEPDRLRGITLAAIVSHLACADRPADPMNAAQRDAFRAAVARLPPAPASLAASSGIFLGPDFHFGMVRPGAALYGVNPLPGIPNPMRQVIHLKGRILQVREIDRGGTVGYGAAHRMDRPGRIATGALGYADGWLRSSSHRGSVGIAGERVPVVGRISMDLLTLDVTGIDPAATHPGALVDVLDADYGVDDAAAAASTIGYEILTALGRRALRIYKEDSQHGAVG